MPKSDKELTVEIVCAIYKGWGQSPNSKPLEPMAAPAIIKEIHKTLSELKDKTG